MGRASSSAATAFLLPISQRTATRAPPAVACFVDCASVPLRTRWIPEDFILGPYSPIAQQLRSQVQVRTRLSTPDTSAAPDRAILDTVYRQIEFLVWQLAPVTLDDTTAELELLGTKYGSLARERIQHALQDAATDLHTRVHDQLLDMWQGLPDVTPNGQVPVPPGASSHALLEAALEHLAQARPNALTAAALAPFLAPFLSEPRSDVPRLERPQRHALLTAVAERAGSDVLQSALEQSLGALRLAPGATVADVLLDWGDVLQSPALVTALLRHLCWNATPSDAAVLLGTLFENETTSPRLATNYGALMQGIAALVDNDFDWAAAVRGLDTPEVLTVAPGAALGMGLAAVLLAAPPADTLSDPARVAVAGLWGVWTHRLRQLQLLYALLLPSESAFTFSVLPVRRILSPADVASAPAPVQAQAQPAMESTWNSLDLMETIMELAGSAPGAEDSAEVGKAVTAILERAIKTHAECVLLGLVQLPPSTNAVHPELVTKLLVMFLAGHPSHQLVFWRLWHTQPSLLLDTFQRLYADNALHLTRIVDVAQELGALERLLELRPLALALDAAALAARRDALNLEAWLQRLMETSEGPIVLQMLDFLDAKTRDDLMRRDPQAEPTFVPLSAQQVATFLRVLRAQGDVMSAEEIERFKVVRNLCLQLHPRLMSLTPGTEGTEPGLAVTSFTKDVHREADTWYRQMYEESVSVDDIIALLQRCKHSDDPHEHQLFACMVHTLFDEHRWFELYYPPRELLMTAVVFGSLIQYQLIESIPLGIAIRYVVDALRSPPDSTMFHFGVQALLRFQARLSEWPQLCHALLSLPTLQQTHPELVAVVNAALSKPAPVSDAAFAIAPDALPSDAQRKPAEDASDRILFLLNNLSLTNIDEKLDAARELVTPELLHWLARYLVLERVSIEPNNHELYMQFLDGLEQPRVMVYVLHETYAKLKALLESDKTMQSSNERTVLKNLASWLGGVTLARNRPIRHRNVAFKTLLIQGHERERLIVAIPFVCKVLEQAANSDVFQPPNPWLMAVLRLLVELYHYADLKLNLKFEIEVLCKGLQVDLPSVEPSALLAGRRPEPPEYQAPLVAGMEKLGVEYAAAAGAPVAAAPSYADTFVAMLQNMAQYIVINPQIVPYANSAAWKRVMYVALERAIQEIITPVVERSVTIASISTRELVSKDFALEPDELKLRKAAHQMAQNMAGSLALVTCKEPLRISILAHARTLFIAGGVTEQQLPEQALLLLVQDNLDLACVVIEKTAMEKALAKVDEGLAPAYAARREFRAHARGALFWDSGALSHYSTTLPEPMRIGPPGLQPAQLRVYDQLAMAPAPVRDEALEYEDAGLAPAKVLERFVLMAAELERFFADVGDAQTLATLPSTHFVRELSPHLTELVSQAVPRDETILLLAQKVVQLLYKAQSELAREVWVAVLEQLCEQSPKVAKEVTAWLVYAEDERKFHVPVTMVLIRANLVGVAELDAQLAKLLVRTHFRPSVVDFAAQLARECLCDPPVATRAALAQLLGALHQAAQYGRATPAANALLDELDELPTADPALPLREQLAYSFASWVRAYQHAARPEKAFVEYVTQLQSQNVLKGEEISSLFFRVCTEASVTHYIKQAAVGGSTASGIFAPVDTFAQLVVYMVKYHADPAGVNDEAAKVHYLTKILSIVVLVLAQSHEELGTRFQQKPFFRFFSSLLHDLHAAEGSLRGGTYAGALLAVANALHTLQPLFFPGFAFAWVALVSHRLLLPPLLRAAPAAFHRLMLAQLRFLAPFLRQGAPDSSRLLYQATLRTTLLLLHDFPEYLAEHAAVLCDAVPPACIQLRNLVLCAFPPGMRLPDPFAVRLATLPDAQRVPAVPYDWSSALPPALRDALDAFVAHRTPMPTELLAVVQGGETHVFEPLLHAAALYVAVHAPDALVEWFRSLLRALEPEGRYLLLSAAANELRFPSQHTVCFSALFGTLYVDDKGEPYVREQILRVLLERVIVHRPHPWGLLYTFAQLLRMPVPLPQAPPEIHAMLERIVQTLKDTP